MHYINMKDKYRSSIVIFVDTDSDNISDIKDMCKKCLGQDGWEVTDELLSKLSQTYFIKS